MLNITTPKNIELAFTAEIFLLIDVPEKMSELSQLFLCIFTLMYIIIRMGIF